MLRRKLIESLTARIFFITVLILLGAGAVTFALIAWATPSTYTAVVNDDLQQQEGEQEDTDRQTLTDFLSQHGSPPLSRFRCSLHPACGGDF